MRYLFRHFPLNSIHPHAQKAAEAAECAGEQSKFWEMHDLLFEGQEQWSSSADAVGAFKGMAGDLGLDQAEFDSCLDSGKYADEVSANLDEAVAAGLSSTPSFLIDGAKLAGAQPFAAFQQEIEYALYIAGGGRSNWRSERTASAAWENLMRRWWSPSSQTFNDRPVVRSPVR